MHPPDLIDFLKDSLYASVTNHRHCPQIQIPELAEECQLMDLDPEQETRRRRAPGQAYDEDDEHAPGMNRVQCATS